jgi:hypothetical protein
MNVAPLSTGDNSPVDEVDAILRAFFRSETPIRWPDAPEYAAAIAPASPRRGLNRGRFALAASVAMLLSGTIAVTRFAPKAETPANPLRILPGEATRVRLPETGSLPKDRPGDWRNPSLKEGMPEK